MRAENGHGINCISGDEFISEKHELQEGATFTKPELFSYHLWVFLYIWRCTYRIYLINKLSVQNACLKWFLLNTTTFCCYLAQADEGPNVKVLVLCVYSLRT